MSILVLDPLPERGMRVGVCDEHTWLYTPTIVEHAEDVVALVARIKEKITSVVIRSGIGSFSASRTALVIGTTLSATRGAALIVVSEEVTTPEDVFTAARHPISHFDYSKPPNITVKIKTA